MSAASAGDGTTPEIPEGWDPERPLPGQGTILPPEAVIIADPALEVATSELDPGIPLNMRRRGPAPEWYQKAKDAIREQIKNSGPGEDLGPIVDLSAPGTPDSFLAEAPNSDPECRDERYRDEALAPYGTISFRGYPASSPNAGPPDVSLTVGADYVIAGYNSYFQVYNKVTGASVASFNMSTLYSGLPVCGSPAGICDPQVLYDDFNGGSCPNPTDPRYILVALAYDASDDGRVCVACSKSGMAPTNTANFWKYEFNPAGTGLPDYEKIAVGPDALIVGYNWFGSGYAAAAAITKSNLYAGTTPTTREYTFSPASTYRTPWPATRVGCKQAQTPTYSGTYLTTSTGTSLQLWRWPTPATSNDPVTYGSSMLSATACSNPTGTNITDYNIDCFPTAWQDAEQRGNYLYTTRSATGGAGSGVQYAKFNVSGATPTTVVSGTVTETGNYLWMPSIASDRNYDFGVAFSRASQTNNIRVAGAVAGNEAGTFGAVLVAKAGEVVYNSGIDQNGSYRWGDYSGFAPDPEDGCTLWANTQYARSDTLDDASWINTYKFSGCTQAPQGFMSGLSYTCFSTVTSSIIDTGGTPTNAVYHASNGNTFPATISGGPNTFTVSSVTIPQLGAADGNTVWLSFTGSDAATHNSSASVVGCAVNVCLSSVPTLSGGCDNDAYMDRGETINIFPQFINNESFVLPTGFTADLRVNPSFPDANITIVKGTAEYGALGVGETGGPVGAPFQVRCTGGTNIRTVNFELYNIRATDNSWTGGSSCGASNLLFTKIANANDVITPYSGFPQTWAAAIPTGWAQADVSGTALNWAFATSTTNPTATPYDGTHLAWTNNYADNVPGDSVRLYRTTATDCSAASVVGASFYLYHSTNYPQYNDYIQVQVSTNGSTWTNVGDPVVRQNGSTGWAKHSVDCSSAAAGQATVRLGLLSVNEYGMNMPVDLVDFGSSAAVADAATCSTAAPVLALSSNFQGPGYGYMLYDAQCNFNGYPDAGDEGAMLFYLSNTGNETAYGVTATLSCPSCPAGVTICKNTATYGDIPYGSGYVYAQPDNGFEVAIPAGLASGSALPWVLTVNATNPYTTTINVPSTPDHYYKSWSGTPTQVTNGDPYGYSISDYFDTAPGTAGATGRYGFTTAWSITSGVTRQSNTAGYNGYVARLTGKSSSSPQTMAHTFSTAGIDTDVSVYWFFNRGRAPTTSLFFFEWDNGDGNGFRNFIPGGTGLTGSNAGADAWVQYGYFSLYNQIYYGTPAGYGPVAANAFLNNAASQVRFRVTFATTTTSYWEVGVFQMDQNRYVNEATSCTGVCLAPEAATVTEVRDVDPCVMNGVQVYFNEGIGTSSTALYRDGASVVPAYTSGTTYAPGDTTSHNYTIRSTNSTGTTDSTPAVAGIDAAGTATPTITCSPGTCTHATQVTLTTESGHTNYQWYRGGVAIGGATSNTYNATVTGNYTVEWKLGGCTNLSAVTPVTIGGAVNPPAAPNGDDVPGTPLTISKNGANYTVAWDPSCTNDTQYRLIWGNITSLSLASNVTNGTVTSASCSLGTTGSATVLAANTPSPSGGQCFFCVIDAVNGTQFGRHGNNTWGNERILSGDTTFCSANTKNTTATTCN